MVPAGAVAAALEVLVESAEYEVGIVAGVAKGNPVDVETATTSGVVTAVAVVFEDLDLQADFLVLVLFKYVAPEVCRTTSPPEAEAIEAT